MAGGVSRGRATADDERCVGDSVAGQGVEKLFAALVTAVEDDQTDGGEVPGNPSDRL